MLLNNLQFGKEFTGTKLAKKAWAFQTPHISVFYLFTLQGVFCILPSYI